MSYRFEKNEDGFYRLFDENEMLFEEKNIAFSFDRETGTLFKYGDQITIEKWAEKTRKLYIESGFADLADDIIVVSGDFTVDDINKFLSTAGYIGLWYRRLFGKSNRL